MPMPYVPPAVRRALGVGLLTVGLMGAARTAPVRAAEVTKSAADYARDLEGADKNLKREAAYHLSRMGRAARVALPQLIKALEDDQQQVWFGAIRTLANLGPEAEPALPALLSELDSWQPFRRDRQGAQGLYRTAVALGAIGPAAVPALSNRLTSDKWPARAGAARALGFAGTNGWPVAPALVRTLRDARAEVRDAVTESLVMFGRPSVEPLIGMLSETDETVGRLAALETLGRLGTNAVSGAGAVRALTGRSADSAVRAKGLTTLARLGLPAAELIPWLMAARNDAAQPVRDAATSALLTLRPIGTSLVPVLIQQLRSGDVVARRGAAELITQLGADAEGTAEALAEALRAAGSDAAADSGLATALASVGPAALPPVFAELARRTGSRESTNDWPSAVLRRVDVLALPGLMAGLTNSAARVRAGALDGLIALGPQGRSAGKRVPPLLADPDDGVRSRAWVAAAACGVAPELLLSRLEAGVNDPSAEVRRAALKGMARLGKAAKPALPRLVEALGGGDLDLKQAAMQALLALGPDAEGATSVLARQLATSEPAGQGEILAVLASIGRGAGGALPELKALVQGASPEVRKLALGTLGRMGESAREAQELVSGYGSDADPAIRAASVEAVVGIDPASELAIRQAIRALEDPDVGVRRAAAAAMAKLEERGRPAEARLFAMLELASDRTAALEALRAVHPVSIPALTGALGHREAGVRVMAADMLARLGKEAKDATPVLEKALRDDGNEEVKRAARRALRRIREG